MNHSIPPPLIQRDGRPVVEQVRHRWVILAVACLAVFVTVLDGTIVNVALPTFATDLGASTKQLQWIVDAYLLVFTGLLLAAGGLGDRYGRRRALMVGLVLFGITSAYAGSVDTASTLIVARGLMGIGAALVFPATLAIITDVFRDPTERAKAIGVWSAVAGIAVAAGPITGGWLLEHFWWGSIFFINIPIVIIAVTATWFLVPESADADAPPIDRVGFVLSIAALSALILTIIEAPVWGWTSPTTAVGALVTVGLIVGFVRWELGQEHPLLPVRIFRNLRFSAASVSITSAFFALFGFIFLITQYFQLVRGYSPLQAGVRTLPVAFSIAGAAVLAPLLVQRVGTTRVVATGLSLMAVSFAWISSISLATPYLEIVGQMVLLGVGLGLTTAPATESIMGSVTAGKAGVGSAVNDTTRELGGTLGVAVLGSVFSSVYIASLRDAPVTSTLPDEVQQIAEESVGAASLVAVQLGEAAPAFLAEVSDAFLSGLQIACYVAAGVAAAGAIFALRFLPARAVATAAETAPSPVEVTEPVG